MIYSFFKSKLIRNVLLNSLFCFLLCFVFAEETTWNLAITKLDGKSEFTELVPKLVYETLPKDFQWELTKAEQIARFEKSKETEKKSILSKIKSTQTEKDSLIFKYSSQATIKAKAKECDQKLSEYYIQIDELNSTQLEKFDFTLANVKIHDETKNQNEKLDNSKYDAVLKGTLTENYGFLQVKLQLVSTVTNDIFGEFSVVFPEEELDNLVKELVFQVNQLFCKTETIDFTVKVLPEDAAENSIIRIDQQVYKNSVSALKLTKGEHVISVESKGFETKSFKYDFSEKDKYTVTVNLSKSTPTEITVKIPLLDQLKENASIYVGGNIAQFQNEQDFSVATINVQKLPTLGEITVFNSELEQPITTFVNIKGTENLSVIEYEKITATTRIENARKTMYTSYGLFLLSLPFSFYANGRFNDVSSVIQTGTQTQKLINSYNFWNIGSKVSSGLVWTTGINFVFQLIRYMTVANSVLPKTIE